MHLSTHTNNWLGITQKVNSWLDITQKVKVKVSI